MPKNSLEGQVTGSGWTVTKKINSSSGSGGAFCARYEVTSAEGKVAFLKAMDLASVLHDLAALNAWSNAYLFEQNILEYCKKINMTRVVSPVDMGVIKNPNFSPPGDSVYYIIFDMAEGDLRGAHLVIDEKSRRWVSAFIALHHSAVGVNQLHKADIAHQDIKPSNVLSFNAKSYKISDLGRVVDKKGASPFSVLPFPGDNGYRPLEFDFGFAGSDFVSRLLCDMFMIGSLVYHLVEDVQINISIRSEVLALHPAVFSLDFHTALPFIVSAYNDLLERFKEKCIQKFGEKTGMILYTIVKEMCHPDPSQRGQKKYTSVVARVGLERYIGLLSQVVQSAVIAGVK